MKENLPIPTFNEFDEYYSATKGLVRAKIPDFHVFRLSEIGDQVVDNMPPFRLNYYHLSLGSQLKTNLSVFDQQLISEDFTLVIFMPSQIIQWERTGEWNGYVIDVKERFLDLTLLNQSIGSFQYLYTAQPLVLQLSMEDFTGLSYFYELIYNEYKTLNKESIFIIKNLTQVLLSYINRILQKRLPIPETLKPVFPKHNYFTIASNYQSLVIKGYLQSKAVNYYANKLNVSTSFLNKCTKKAFGKTAKDVINGTLLLHIQTRLKKSDLGIKEIAYELNFDDYSHLVKFFKTQTGLTPAEYRQQMG